MKIAKGWNFKEHAFFKQILKNEVCLGGTGGVDENSHWLYSVQMENIYESYRYKQTDDKLNFNFTQIWKNFFKQMKFSLLQVWSDKKIGENEPVLWMCNTILPDNALKIF